MEVTSSSDTLGPIYKCKWYHITEYRDIRTHDLEFTQSIHRQSAPVSIWVHKGHIRISKHDISCIFSEEFVFGFSRYVWYKRETILNMGFEFLALHLSVCVSHVSVGFRCPYFMNITVANSGRLPVSYICFPPRCSFLVLCITWHTRVICRPLLRFKPGSCQTKVPFGAFIILNSDVNVQMILSWPLKSFGLLRQYNSLRPDHIRNHTAHRFALLKLQFMCRNSVLGYDFKSCLWSIFHPIVLIWLKDSSASLRLSPKLMWRYESPDESVDHHFDACVCRCNFSLWHIIECSVQPSTRNLMECMAYMFRVSVWCVCVWVCVCVCVCVWCVCVCV
jgi:hypothetical protein